ncbi:MAG: restriction endonuclease subunit S [Coriobacteriia bacterium]|nr:restriction endonuclease subunit S [Coriobacteriia bacterium]
MNDWVMTKIGDIADTFSGGTPPTRVLKYYWGEIPFIKSGEINSSTTEQCISSEALQASSAKKVMEGDILLALYGATSGEVAISKIDGAINQAVLCIRTSQDKYFIFYWLLLHKSIILRKYLQGGQGNLSAAIVKNLTIDLPPIEEQQRIVGVLEVWDRALGLLDKKIELKEQAKKGLMQQLLSEKKRLPGYLKKWEETPFASLGESCKGYGVPKAALAQEGHPAFTYGELYTLHRNRIKEITSFIDDKVAADSAEVNRGDILLAGSGETSEEIGSAACYDSEEPGYAGGDIIIFRPDDKQSSLFITYQINTVLRKQFWRYSQGQSVVHIYQTNFDEITACVPEFNEQQEIAAVLEAADAELEALRKKRELIAAQRAYLLNNLVTGNITVPESMAVGA